MKLTKEYGARLWKQIQVIKRRLDNPRRLTTHEKQFLIQKIKKLLMIYDKIGLPVKRTSGFS